MMARILGTSGLTAQSTLSSTLGVSLLFDAMVVMQREETRQCLRRRSGVSRHGNSWRAKIIHNGRLCLGPARAERARAEADLAEVHIEDKRRAMFEEQHPYEIGKVEIHGNRFRARVSRRKGPTRQTKKEAVDDLHRMRAEHKRRRSVEPVVVGSERNGH